MSKKHTKSIFIIAMIGLGFAIMGCSSNECPICGSYTFNQYVDLNDPTIASMFEESGMEKLKENQESDPAAIHVLSLDDPETLDDGTLRGSVLFGIQTKYIDGLKLYKGSFIQFEGEKDVDGMIRVEYQKVDGVGDWEKIIFSNSQNMIFFKIADKQLILSSKSTDGFLGICCYDESKFVLN
jgi:hypothetical protein